MKETRLGDFEEVILLLVGILGEQAYAFKIAEEFESQTGRVASIGSVHSTMDRLSNKGFLTSEMGQPSTNRGGRRKRI
ncbi:MAG: DNA-binding PadR family transcriptional regulator, partial [Marinoscillum sp.]